MYAKQVFLVSLGTQAVIATHTSLFLINKYLCQIEGLLGNFN